MRTEAGRSDSFRLSTLPVGPLVDAAGDANGMWHEVPPPRRYECAAAYDALGDRLLVYGGSRLGERRDLWALPLGDTTGWNPVPFSPVNAPPALQGAVSCFDAAHRRLFLFGGDAYPVHLDVVYVLALDPVPTWSMLDVPPFESRPNHSRNGSIAYDSARDQVVTFGGWHDTSLVADVWTAPVTPTTHWSRIEPPGDRPAPRTDASMVYDPVGDRMIVYGGSVFTAPRRLDVSDEIWQLTLGDAPVWTRITPGGDLPGPRAGHLAWWDEASGTMLVTGGYAATANATDVYRFDPVTATWSIVSATGPVPIARNGGAVAHDSARDRYLFYGGTAGGNDNLDVDALTLRPAAVWHKPGTRPLPSGRFGQATVLDVRHDRMIIFGGVDDVDYLSDPWSLSLGDVRRWTPIDAAGPAPPPRHEPVGVYDARRDRAVFFGGWTYPSNYFTDTWVLSMAGAPAWSQATPDGDPPPGRRGHAAVYDPLGDRMLVFGGANDDAYFADVWELDLAGAMRWRRLETHGTPPAGRIFPAMIFDPTRNRLVVHGGGSDTHSKSDAWELSLADLTWHPIETPPHAPELERHMASYDAARDRMLVFGGWAIDYDVVQSSQATFALEFRPQPHWTYLRTTGSSSDSRAAHSQVLDPLRDRLVVFGGSKFFTHENDLFTLDFDTSRLRRTWLVGVTTSPGHARVVWQCTDGASALFSVERRQEGGEWRTIGTALADAEGLVTWEADRDLSPGWRYAYRLRAGIAPDTPTESEVTVDIPGGPQVQFLGAWPNPARGSTLAVWFALADTKPAWIDVYDVRGRRVSHVDLPNPAPGPQSLRSDGYITPGLYFVTVTQGGSSATRKLTILP